MKTYDESETPNHSDTEITLGMQSILGIFFGLVLICGVFFGFGYSLGRGNANKALASAPPPPPPSETTQSPTVKTVVEDQASSDQSVNAPYTYIAGPGGPTRKPAGASLPTKPSAGSALPQVPNAVISTPENTPPANESSVAKSSNNVPAPAKTTPAISLGPGSTSSVAAAVMVQIAAVSHREDADVLVSALNKLGYNASVRNETTDSLLHVQIGPFTTRDQAMAMRTKLLNDGYNAILK
jgi:DedD protein